MKKWVGAFFAGALLSAPVIHAEGMSANPFGMVFAPWNTMPGGFSPLNNGFTSGGPMGMSSFALSPWSAGGSPWGAVPNNVMPWNAWSSGSVVPWANRMPFNNQTGSGIYPNMTGIPMPWGGKGSQFWLPYANGYALPYGYQRGQTRNNDTWRTMMMLNSIHGNQAGLGNIVQPVPGLGLNGGLAPALPAAPAAVTPIPATVAQPSARLAPPARSAAAGTFPGAGIEPSAAGTLPAKPFDPFARDAATQLAPVAPEQPLQPTAPTVPVKPEQPQSFDPFAGGLAPAPAAGEPQFPDGSLF